MSTTRIYDAVISRQPEELDRKVGEIMQKHVGIDARIDKRALVIEATGEYNDTNERRVRQSIENLRNLPDPDQVPILSQSGVSGYWIAESRAKLVETCNEMEARGKNIIGTAAHLRKARLPEDGRPAPRQMRAWT